MSAPQRSTLDTAGVDRGRSQLGRGLAPELGYDYRRNRSHWICASCSQLDTSLLDEWPTPTTRARRRRVWLGVDGRPMYVNRLCFVINNSPLMRSRTVVRCLRSGRPHHLIAVVFFYIYKERIEYLHHVFVYSVCIQ